MGNLLIRHIPRETLLMAKEIARKNHHSLQEEVSNILIESVRFRAGRWSTQADAIRKRLSKKKKLYSDSAVLQREDRDR